MSVLKMKTLTRKLVVAFVMLLLVSSTSHAAFFRPDVRPGYGVTSQGWLSDYCESLRGTNLDTPVFFLDSGKPGASALVLCGTHPRELAGVTSATMLVENCEVKVGRLVVIPCLNVSGMSIPDQNGKVPHFLPIESRSGLRYLPYGDRYVDIQDQGQPDPEKFQHFSGYEIDDGAESRNINRNYPGKKDGTPTAQVAFGVMELIRKEKINFSIDLHESGTPDYFIDRKNGEVSPGSRLAYMLVCNPKALEIGAETVLALEEKGISLKVDQSNPEFRGLSHLEIGNTTDCLSFLSETPNPGQDTWREAPDVISDSDYPLKMRVGICVEVVKSLADIYGETTGKKLVMENVPSYEELQEKDVGAFLN
jgi:hypothetical protein